MADKTIIQSLPALPNPIPQSNIRDDRAIVVINYAGQTIPNLSYTQLTSGSFQAGFHSDPTSVMTINASGDLVFSRRCIFSTAVRSNLVTTDNSINVFPRLTHRDSSGNIKIDVSYGYDPSNYTNREGGSLSFDIQPGDYIQTICFHDHSTSRAVAANLRGVVFKISEV